MTTFQGKTDTISSLSTSQFFNYGDISLKIYRFWFETGFSGLITGCFCLHFGHSGLTYGKNSVNCDSKSIRTLKASYT